MEPISDFDPALPLSKAPRATSDEAAISAFYSFEPVFRMRDRDSSGAVRPILNIPEQRRDAPAKGRAAA